MTEIIRLSNDMSDVTLEEAFAELHALDIREPLRRFQPKVMLVAVNKDGIIKKIEKFNKPPDVEDLHRFASDCIGTSIFIANRENFKSLDKFRKVVLENGEAIRRRIEGD